MKFYENDMGFCLLEDDEKLPKGAKPYEVKIPIKSSSNCEETFPQFELKIISTNIATYSYDFEIVYKKIFTFRPKVEHPLYYILRLLNDLKNNNYEEKILEYFKDSKTPEEFFKIKEQLAELNDIEKLQQSNNALKEEVKVLLEEKKAIEDIEKDIKFIKDEIEVLKSKGNFSSWLKSFQLTKSKN